MTQLHSGEVNELREGFELVKCFSKSASESLTVILGSSSRYLILLFYIYKLLVYPFSDGVFLFMRKLCSKLDSDCNQFLCWVNSMEYPVSHEKKVNKQQISSLVGHILVCVQRIMLRDSNFRTTSKLTIILRLYLSVRVCVWLEGDRKPFDPG